MIGACTKTLHQSQSPKPNAKSAAHLSKMQSNHDVSIDLMGGIIYAFTESVRPRAAKLITTSCNNLKERAREQQRIFHIVYAKCNVPLKFGCIISDAALILAESVFVVVEFPPVTLDD